jgi:hypothetical protein
MQFLEAGIDKVRPDPRRLSVRRGPARLIRTQRTASAPRFPDSRATVGQVVG